MDEPEKKDLTSRVVEAGKILPKGRVAVPIDLIIFGRPIEHTVMFIDGPKETEGTILPYVGKKPGENYK